jgi:5'-nucleotidase
VRIFIDMDNVLVDFQSALAKRGLPLNTPNADDLDGLFAEMEPMPGALESYRELVAEGHDVYILSTAPWDNPSAWSDKLLWVQKHLGDVAYKRLILSHHKNLLRGDVLIDDRRRRGAGAFSGYHIHFGKPGPGATWPHVLKELRDIC